MVSTGVNIFLTVTSLSFLVACHGAEKENAEITEDFEENEDPIIEDLTKVDTTNLPVVSRESKIDPKYNCEHIILEETVHSYFAETKSGKKEEVYLQSHLRTGMEKILNPIKATNSDQVGHIEYMPFLNCFQQDDPDLIQFIQEMLVKPSGEEPVFDDLEQNLYGEVGHPLDVDKLVFGGQLKHGFYLEAGASDSETYSDTLHFEVNHGWNGLLVEPHPLLHDLGVEKKRNATLLKTCFSTETKPQFVKFDLEGVWRNEEDNNDMMSMGGIVTDQRDTSVKMQCIPLYSILLAIGNPTINYFSLDIEGAEFAVLKTLPWDKVDIQVLTIETHMLGSVFPGTREDLIEYMDSVGYNHIKDAHKGTNALREELGTTDDLFVKKGLELKELQSSKKDEL